MLPGRWAERAVRMGVTMLLPLERGGMLWAVGREGSGGTGLPAWTRAAGRGHSQHSMGLEATCSDSVLPLGCRDVDAEDQPHPACSFSRCPSPLAQLDVGVPELGSGTVDAVRQSVPASVPQQPCP